MMNKRQENQDLNSLDLNKWDIVVAILKINYPNMYNLYYVLP